MRAITVIQAAFAVGFLLFGFSMLFAIGITGLLIMVPGVIFGVIASFALSESRVSTIVALIADGALGYFAVVNILTAYTPNAKLIALNPGVQSLLRPAQLTDFIVPSIALVLVVGAFAAAMVDWRAIRTAKWL